eukprot:1740124-Rhodomonas_salina.3
MHAFLNLEHALNVQCAAMCRFELTSERRTPLHRNDLQRLLERLSVEIDEEDVEALMSRHCEKGGEWGGARAVFEEFCQMVKDKSISQMLESTPLPDVTVPIQQNRALRASGLFSRRSSA